jgi:hypothetical protein
MAASLSARPCRAVGEGVAGLALIAWRPETASPSAISSRRSRAVGPPAGGRGPPPGAEEGRRHAGREAPRQRGDDVLAGPSPLLPDEPQQRRLGGEQDASLPEELPSPGQQGGGLLQAAGLLEEEAFQGLDLFGAEGGQPEELPDAVLVVRDRVLPGRVIVDPGRVDVQLHGDEAQQLVADFQGLLGREAMEQADEADLVGESQAVVLAAAVGDCGQIGLGQGRFADQLPPREGGDRHGCRALTRKTSVILAPS